jgi:hypothetical protein
VICALTGRDPAAKDTERKKLDKLKKMQESWEQQNKAK